MSSDGGMILDADPITGVIERFYWDEETQTATIRPEQDVTPMLELSKAEYNSIDERARWGNGMTHVARIPGILVFDLMKRGIWGDDAAMKKWLNDPDNRFFRTRPGRV